MTRLFIRKLICFMLIWSMLAMPWASASDNEVMKEYLIKAAFIYNFAKFVEWPPCEGDCMNDKIVLCVFGKDVFGEAIESILGKTIKDRALSVRYVSQPKEIVNSHILFVSASESERIDEILKVSRGQPILTISDVEGFARRGGMIEFMKVQSKIRFGINQGAAAVSSIKISSHLLKLAQFVVE